MTSSDVAWKKVLGGVLAAEVVLVMAAVLWVAIYSHVIAPGLALNVYRQHAQWSGPWVSVIVGIPVFYLLGHWLRSRRAAMMLFGLYLVLDMLLIVVIPAPAQGPLPLALLAASYSTKLVFLLAGARRR